MTYHIIDHAGFGTIHKLLLPLHDEKKNHIVWKFCDCLGLLIIYPFNRSLSKKTHFNKKSHFSQSGDGQ